MVYTTRPDTLFGATYMVLSPEHELIRKWMPLLKNADDVQAYQKEAASKSDLERTELNKEKTGVCLDGVKGINPVNGKEIPIFHLRLRAGPPTAPAPSWARARPRRPRLGVCQEVRL